LQVTNAQFRTGLREQRMHILVIATDFDGTISEGDQLNPEAGRVLRHWREAGRFTVLASGRPFDFLRDLGEREAAFDLIVAENGAVLYDPHTDEMRLPFGEVPGELLDMLAGLGVPLWRGIAIAGTRQPYDDAVWVASRELGLAVHVETNRNEVMLLPPGASKGAGLLNLLRVKGLSPRNLLAIGDAENDHSLLQVAEVRVSVANAVESLKRIADHVTAEPGPTGATTFIERYLLDGRAFDFPVRGAHHFCLDAAAEVNLNGYELVDRDVLITGGSGHRKSWLASRLADGLVDGGYQFLGLDPVGDLHSLSRHASCLCLGTDAPPPMSLVVQLLTETDLSLVLDLSHMPTPEERVLYTTGLLRQVIEVHRRFGKPHWLLIDEAQDLLGGQDNPARLPLLQGLKVPGVCLVTWRPSCLDDALLDKTDGLLLTRQSLKEEIECLGRLLANRGIDVTGLAERLGGLGEGQALVWGLTPSADETLMPFRFGTGPRIFPSMHHLHQHLEQGVAPARQFYFRDQTGHTLPASNLGELIDRVRTLDLTALTFHFRRGDFGRWVRDVLHDEILARWLDRLRIVDLSGEELRLAFLEALEQRYRTLERLI
jgi:hydroxymethylpyrimidine pyrophosphatase-like HAD family hydrolase